MAESRVELERRARAHELSAEAREEIELFRREIARLEAGEADPDDFKKFRLENGVYGIRGQPDLHMVRVKIRFGALNPDQLEALADIASIYTPNKIGHITTRQDMQFHYVRRRDVPEVLERIALVGLTTREACGNTVRNVTACPYSGISPTEVFDVTPYADALSRYFLRNPICQNLPRKFKIAFEGCPEDHARTPIHDIGCVAAVREAGGRLERGFRMYLGGGLGAQPRVAQLLEEFTPEDLLIPTAEATLRIFDRHGERRPEAQYRARARMKFLIKEWGFEKFRSEVLKERRVVLATRSGRAAYRIEAGEERPPEVDIPAGDPPGWRPTLDYLRWRETNVLAQKRKGWQAVIIRCPLGDIGAAEMRVVADIARRYCGGRLRTLITQNLLLRWVPEGALPWVYMELVRAGLARAGAHRIADITRCPGADTCQIAITHSRGLAAALGNLLSNGFGQIPEIQDISIKISGCFNSCGQHHIADIGFYGATEEVSGHALPKYVMLLGGRTAEGMASFGKAVIQIPARRVPEAVEKLLRYYLSERQPEEPFRSFIDRVGIAPIRELLAEFKRVPLYEQAPDLYRDLGAEDEGFKLELGTGECAS